METLIGFFMTGALTAVILHEPVTQSLGKLCNLLGCLLFIVSPVLILSILFIIYIIGTPLPFNILLYDFRDFSDFENGIVQQFFMASVYVAGIVSMSGVLYWRY